MSDDRKSGIDPPTSTTEQASSWWVALDAPQATPADHEAFRRWVVGSPERIEAILETARLTRLLKSKHARWPDTPVEVLAREVREAGADVEPLFSGVPGGSNPSKHHSRRPTLLFAVAAGVAGLLAGGWVAFGQAHRYATAIGEQRSVALQDGSIVTLNTASRIEVRFDRHHRLIRLLAGEALFQAAKDTSRPFEVQAGDATVRALGTQFNVYRKTSGITVTVVEGKVAVSSAIDSRADSSSQPAPFQGKGGNTTFLSAGEQLIVEQRKPAHAAKPADIATATAWTQRRLVFDHRPIGEVAREFNRYNTLQIEIAGDVLRNENMTAVFRANDPRSFLDFVAKMPGVRVERSDTQIRLSTAP